MKKDLLLLKAELALLQGKKCLRDLNDSKKKISKCIEELSKKSGK